MPTRAPRMTSGQPMQRHVGAGYRAVRLDGLERIRRAGRLESAGAAQPRAQHQPVATHERRQNTLWQVHQGEMYGISTDTVGCRSAARCVAALSTSSSSARALRRRASDAALGNVVWSNAARRRTIHKPASNASARAETASRIWRLINERVGERRAWRFGTTIPSQIAVTETDSSTGPSAADAVAVDNSPPEGAGVRTDFNFNFNLPGRSGR